MIQIVRNVKNHIQALIKDEDFIELFDVDNNSVVFFTGSQDEIKEGIDAQPDGEFLFSDGMKVVIEGGKVISVEMPEEVTEEIPVEETVTEEPVNEGEEVTEEETVEEQPQPEEDKDAKIAELENKLEELAKMVEQLKKNVEDKDKELEEAKDCLTEVQNFYSKVSNKQMRTEITDEKNAKQPNFRIK